MSDHLVLILADRMERFEYQTVDIPTYKGRPQIDVTCNQMAQEEWRPVAVISPTLTYPKYSILFERMKKEDA